MPDASVSGAAGVLSAKRYSLQLQRLTLKVQSQPNDMQDHATSNMEGTNAMLACCANL